LARQSAEISRLSEQHHAILFHQTQPREPFRGLEVDTLEPIPGADRSSSESSDAAATRSHLEAELQAARVEIEELRWQLGESERVKGSMAATLREIGIRIGPS
jgi:hypothetical protein